MERLVEIVASGMKSFSNEDRKEYDSLKEDPEFWKAVDKATDAHEYNTKQGLLRYLYHDLERAETSKDRLPIIKFIYEMSVQNKINDKALNITITRVKE